MNVRPSGGNADHTAVRGTTMNDDSFTPVTVDGKRAVVIGGTSGIGQSIAYGFAADGADVIATSRRESAVKETANRLRDLGAETIAVTCDVTKQDSIDKFQSSVLDAFGEVDLVVTSQGAISRDSVREISDEAWDQVIDVQLNGVKRVVQAFSPSMAEGGNFIIISSLTARLAMANVPAYSAAKGGVEAFVRAAAKELAPEIRVNGIAPGFVITPQNADQYAEGMEKRERIERRCPLGRVGDREEMVGAAIYLGSDAASYTTAEILTVDGGFAPSAL